MPYHFEVSNFTEAKNLAPISPNSMQTNWTSPQVNQANTGFVNVTIDPAKIVPRFSRPVEFGGLRSQVLSSDGLIYIVNNDLDWSIPFASTYRSQLVAVNESTGKVQWKYAPGDRQSKLGQPIILGNYIYLFRAFTTSLWTNVTLEVIDKFTGVLFAEFDQDTNMSFIESTYLGTPNIDPYNPKLNALYYKNAEANDISIYTPSAVYSYQPEQFAGTYSGREIYRLGQLFKNSRDGKPSVAVSDREYDRKLYEGFSFYPTRQENLRPVFHSQDQILVNEASRAIADRSLINFDWKLPRQKWDISGYFRSVPVTKGDELYIVNFNQVEARKISDGSLLWAWSIPNEKQGVISGRLPHDPISNQSTFGDHLFNERISSLFVTNNVLFIGTGEHVYAIDTISHKLVWSFPRGGYISMSKNGVLYLANPRYEISTNPFKYFNPILFAFNTR